MNNNEITPPPELVRQWIDNDDFPFATGTLDLVSITKDRLISVANQAARWGADQELEACVNWLLLNGWGQAIDRLRAARRGFNNLNKRTMIERTPNPPEDKFKCWEDDILNERENVDVVLDCAWKDGYRAGADAELDACCEWAAEQDRGFDDELRAARRPKPPSLKEQALKILDLGHGLADCDRNTLRRALEQLDD